VTHARGSDENKSLTSDSASARVELGPNASKGGFYLTLPEAITPRDPYVTGDAAIFKRRTVLWLRYLHSLYGG